jgi:hypothetical protein
MIGKTLSPFRWLLLLRWKQSNVIKLIVTVVFQLYFYFILSRLSVRFVMTGGRRVPEIVDCKLFITNYG